MSTRKQIGPDDVVDMELHCVACGTRLYVPALQAAAVIASLCDPDLYLWASATHSIEAPEEARLTAGSGSCVASVPRGGCVLLL